VFIRYGVGLIGVTYVVLGLLGFVTAEWLNPVHAEGVGARYLLGLVAINWMHNLIHLGIGITGVWASATLERCRVWGRVVGVVLLLVFAAGMLQAVTSGYPRDQLLLKLVPLNSPGHMLHLATGGLALYLALARSSQSSQALL
jgi:hypothetical protein